VFPNEVAGADQRGLRLVSTAPGGRLWIYRVARAE
jgi:hypothetical protein